MGPFETECKERASKSHKALFGITPPPPTPLPKVVVRPPGTPYTYQKTHRFQDWVLAMRIDRRPVTVKQMLKAVGDYFQVPIKDALANRRQRQIVMVRHITMYIARHCTDLSYPEIARSLGGMDHTTVLHGVRRIEQRMRDNPAFKATVDILMNEFRR